MLSHLELENFTIFHALSLDFTPGINVFVGPNSTGKTHLLKLLYAVTEAHRLGNNIAQKILRVFLPEPPRLGRLVRRTNQAQSGRALLRQDGHDLSFRISSNQSADSFSELKNDWPEATAQEGHPVFIPPKDMLAHAPGFRSLYDLKEIHFEETYRDILVRAFSPVSKGAPDAPRRALKAQLENLISGKITVENEHFYLTNDQGKLEFTLLAEGLRKFALLLQLVENGTLSRSSLLFWDEPEANINPLSIRDLVALLLYLHREMGVQVFLATHSDFVLKELDLMQRPGEARFFALYRDADRVVVEVADQIRHPREHGLIAVREPCGWELEATIAGKLDEAVGGREAGLAIADLAPPKLEVDNTGNKGLGAEENPLEQGRVVLPESIREHPLEVRSKQITPPEEGSKAIRAPGTVQPPPTTGIGPSPAVRPPRHHRDRSSGGGSTALPPPGSVLEGRFDRLIHTGIGPREAVRPPRPAEIGPPRAVRPRSLRRSWTASGSRAGRGRGATGARRFLRRAPRQVSWASVAYWPGGAPALPAG